VIELGGPDETPANDMVWDVDYAIKLVKDNKNTLSENNLKYSKTRKPIVD
jgi:hypothetical protein